MLAPKFARLISFALLAAVLPMAALYIILMKASTPTPTGGIDWTSATICYFAWTMIFGALITVVINFAMQLAREAKGQYRTP